MSSHIYDWLYDTIHRTRGEYVQAIPCGRYSGRNGFSV
jgi:hypothetical protein